MARRNRGRAGDSRLEPGANGGGRCPARRCAIWIVLGAAVILSLYVSPRAFWIDAPSCVSAVAEGRRVIHPPGYVGFLFLARVIDGIVGSPYRALQIISTFCYLASIPVLCLALHRQTTPGAARALTVAYAAGWVCLNIATVGTSHSADLLFGAILVYLASQRRRVGAHAGGTRHSSPRSRGLPRSA